MLLSSVKKAAKNRFDVKVNWLKMGGDDWERE